MNRQDVSAFLDMRLTPTLAVTLLLTTATACAQPFTLSRTFDDPTPNVGSFGWSVALDGNRVLIGAQGDDTFGRDVGQAHLFDARTGDLLRTFDDPTVTDRDRFGYSVALDGGHVLIGAPFDDTNGENVGQAHLFDATTGDLLHTFDDPTPTPDSQIGGDVFGGSVALDGNRVLIGAGDDDTNGTLGGQAHLFDATTGNLLRTFDDPTVTHTDVFGSSVALEGNRALIGAVGDDTHGEDAGQAHLFDATTGDLLRTFNDPTPNVDGSFGSFVALDGNRALVVAKSFFGGPPGQAHLFDATTGMLLHTLNDPTRTEHDRFGNSAALDGNRVLIGAPGDDTNGNSVGQAHLFDAISGNLLQTVDDPTVTEVDTFGTSVSLDGNHVLIGAPGDDTNGTNVGQSYLFAAIPDADFNDDGLIDCADVDSLVAEIVAGTNNQLFDLTGDNLVDTSDLDEWRVQGGAANLPSGNAYLEGDATLDGTVDGLDFIAWNDNKFSPLPVVFGWCEGNFNADGAVDDLDFILWNENKFTSSDEAIAVPEPSFGVLWMAALIGLAALTRDASTSVATASSLS